ncbi:peptidoglycan-binding protein [Candidatus Methylopumilus universalis]|jgi:peptidoglycan-associated lipoprotein|uniref:Peptidoglycan-binding protein n=1 Tax=Candidatus Methylopumilus universalis TaxID=2588536 RepID=A0ABX5VUP9_9PROT|nr:OmpA family protein [Candidatus Methylopumilus universalis]QDC46536.1 peptidoglycan-binding protein [Candidatus Methylopumilus universalis]QDC51559.1 peptidoglycan-binding protein [Candidatus Methylopumilus universalis]QDC61696.1 peptidoglycan-binding protein [Candidatus Methylopumilus universalis]
MKKSLFLASLLSLFLIGCSSTPIVDVSKPAGPSASNDSSDEKDLDLASLRDPNNILSKRSIYFDYDKDTVKAEYKDLLAAHAKYVASHPKAKMTLTGNTDDRGSREYNVSLGQKRSVSVKKSMNVLGAQDAQIETVSFGEERADTNCKDDACYGKDRRVDISYEKE